MEMKLFSILSVLLLSQLSNLGYADSKEKDDQHTVDTEETNVIRSKRDSDFSTELSDLQKRVRDFVGKPSDFPMPETDLEYGDDIKTDDILDSDVVPSFAGLMLSDHPPADVEYDYNEKVSNPFQDFVDGSEINKRPRQFIGKRPRQFVGKRPRQFIGKRPRQFIGKRPRQFVGKRPRQFVGKRPRQFVGKRLVIDEESPFLYDDFQKDIFEDSDMSDLEKRPRQFVGKRQSYRAFELFKRPRQFIGKRPRQFVGKRESDFVEFSKRPRQFIGKRSDYLDFAKRPRQFVGKRSDEIDFAKRPRQFVGKRSGEIDFAKRPRQFVGKREDDGEDMLSKRPRQFVGKRENDDMSAAKRPRQFVGKRDDDDSAIFSKRPRQFVGKRRNFDLEELRSNLQELLQKRLNDGTFKGVELPQQRQARDLTAVEHVKEYNVR